MRTTHLLILCLLCGLAACATPGITVLSDPLDAREHNDLGVTHEASGRPDLALEAYARAAEKDRTWDQPPLNHGNVHASGGNWDEAEKSYRLALKRNPRNPEAMNNLAYALTERGRGAEALEWAAKALAVEPDNPAFRGTMARALSRTGRKAEALALVRRTLLDLPPGDPRREKLHALQGQITDAPP